MLDIYLNSFEKSILEVQISKYITHNNKRYSFYDVARDYYEFLKGIDDFAQERYFEKVKKREEMTLLRKSKKDKFEIMAEDACNVHEAKQRHKTYLMFNGDIIIAAEATAQPAVDDGFEEETEELPNIEDDYDL